MKRVCMTKRDLADAQERQRRNENKRERGQKVEDVEIILVCKPCNGGRLEEGVIFDDLEDILCDRHGLRYRQKENSELTLQDFRNQLQPCDEFELPQLYKHVRSVAATHAVCITA
jgi:hypothetical protein